jgi:hypothetical protein
MAVNTSRALLSVFGLVGIVFCAACSLIVPPKEEEPPPVVEEPVAPEAKYSDEQYEELLADYRAMGDQAARAELLLLERDAQIMELQQRAMAQQRIIDETIAEVVRTKAKLRSVESKAEAASQIAEAEIALNALGEMSDAESSEDYGNAAELMEMAADAFDDQNYGGAIYLTSQAKTLISLAQLRYGEGEPVQVEAGETAFGLPVPLQVVRRSNLRDGPGTGFAVLATLTPGTEVTGYSYKGKWVRVRLEDGTEGWIYLTLIGRR